MPASTEVVEQPVLSPVAVAARAVKRSFLGAASPPIGPTKILSVGHTRSGQLNDPQSKDLHFLHAKARTRNKLISLAFIASAILVPYGAVKTTTVFHIWQAEREASERQARAEAAAKVAQAEAAAKVAAQELAASAAKDMAEKLPGVFAGFVDKAIVDAKLDSTPATTVFNAETMKVWSSAYWDIDAGKTPDFVQQMEPALPWTRLAQFRKVANHGVMLMTVVDDAGVRKVWVGLVQDMTGAGSGKPRFMQTVTGIPGIDPQKLYVAPDFGAIDFNKIRGVVTTSFLN
jgi:hypothetical protein